MLQVTVLAVGKLKEAHWTNALREYEKRLQAFCKFSVVEIEEHRLPRNPSDAQIREGLRQEGRAILGKIPPRSRVIPLCIEGTTLSSPALAEKLAALSQEHSHMVFVVGGSHGLSDEVKQAAAFRLSMSPMTFPHQLARVMLAEQVYRALSILAHQKYHK